MVSGQGQGWGWAWGWGSSWGQGQVQESVEDEADLALAGQPLERCRRQLLARRTHLGRRRRKPPLHLLFPCRIVTVHLLERCEARLHLVRVKG